ncbi:MAG: carbonic anhydrase [Myxococcaceae bacterium]
MPVIDSILARNAKEATAFAPRSSPRLCVVACDDAALTVQLDAALGLRPGEVTMIRTAAGSGALSEELLQRGVAKAIYVEGCDEVLLLTHSSCTLYGLRTEQLIETIARAGVARSSIPFDLRELVGAGRDPRQAVMDSANALRRCAFLPSNLVVHVAHLDEASGALQLVEHGTSVKVERGPSSSESIQGYQAGPSRPLEATIAASNIPVTEVPVIDTLALGAVVPFEAATPLASVLPQFDAMPELPQAALAPPLVPAAPIPVVQLKKRPAQQPSHPPPLSKPSTSPKLQRAVDTVRTFMREDLPAKERQWAKAALAHAAEEGQSADALVKIVLQPVLKSGNKRYRVIDEMILVKDEVSKMTAQQAFGVLRGMVE